MFDMNRRKILKFLERKSTISGKLSCLATGLIDLRDGWFYLYLLAHWS